ncbi:MAG: cellulase family glycosylhydrolase [Acidimicrobiales bacterium]
MSDPGSPSRPQRPVLVIGTLVVAIVALTTVGIVLAAHDRGPTRAASVPTSQPPAGAGIRVVGTQILGPGGKPFVPYGIVVTGFSDSGWRASLPSDNAQIKAIATAWHGNTVRLQVAPEDLFPGGSTHPDATFLADLNKTVTYARSLGLVVIITAQTEHSTQATMPDASIVAFWKLIAPAYSHDPDVWFDLFNEPRLKHAESSVWDIWQNGGDGYVGMQSLVDTIRASAGNVILAEGVDFARTLAGLSGHWLSGYNIVYEVHAFFVRPGDVTPTAWSRNWGNLSKKVPIVIGAWSEYAAKKADCVTNAKTLVPEFLDYVNSHGLGLIGWTLRPGVLIDGTDLAKPTTFSPDAPYVCSNQEAKADPQGAGQDLMRFFAANALPAPAVG